MDKYSRKNLRNRIYKPCYNIYSDKLQSEMARLVRVALVDLSHTSSRMALIL
jgi:hypothetical protein